MLVLCDNSFLQNQELVNGRTGNVSFNGAGDRVNAVYEVVNIQSSGSVPVGNCIVSNVSSVVYLLFRLNCRAHKQARVRGDYS